MAKLPSDPIAPRTSERLSRFGVGLLTFGILVPLAGRAAGESPTNAATDTADSVEEPAPTVPWRWRRHHAIDYVVTGAFTTAALVGELVPHEDEPRWRQTNDLDNGIRNAFGLDNHTGRTVAARISDITIAALLTHRFVDTAFVTWAGHGAGDAAWQMTVMDMQAIAFTLALTSATKRLSDRERPSGNACRTDGGYDNRCEAQSHHKSFFSGHASLAFTAASLTCTHHLNSPLYGGQSDTIACVAALLGATSVGFERILADRHHFTDVFAGALVGALSGALLPWASFYSRGDGSGQDIVTSWSVAPTAANSGGGVSLQGLF